MSGVGLCCLVCGGLLLAGSFFDAAEFSKLEHLTGTIEQVERLERGPHTPPSMILSLDTAVGPQRLEIDFIDGYPIRMNRLSLGAKVEAWVQRDSLGKPFLWEVRRGDEVLVPFKQRLETSRQLQQVIGELGWPLLGFGLLLMGTSSRGRRKGASGKRQEM